MTIAATLYQQYISEVFGKETGERFCQHMQPRGATGTAAEIESYAAGDVLGDDRGQIAVCQIVGAWELESRIGFRSLPIVVYIGK